MSRIPQAFDAAAYGLTDRPTVADPTPGLDAAPQEQTSGHQDTLTNYGLTPEPLVKDGGQRQTVDADTYFKRMDENPNRNWADKVMANVGPVGRGAARGGEAIGNFVVNSVMRGLSYVPGAAGLSDLADHNNRVAQLERAYDMHLDETGTFADVFGPGVARATGSIAESGADTLLTAGAGKLAKIKTPTGFVNWFAANQGARETERALTQATDAGITGPQRLVYAGSKGAITALFTKAFGLLGEKVGGQTTSQIMASGPARALEGLFTREGLKHELLGMTLEMGQQEGTAASQAMWDQLNGFRTWDDYKKHFGEAAITGAVSRGVFGAGRKLSESLSRVTAAMPDTVDGTLDAQAVKAGTKTEPKSDASPAYKAAYDQELTALAELEGEVNKRLEPIRGKQQAHEEEVAKAAEFETHINKLKKELADNGNVESPQREKLQGDLDQMKAQLDAELDRLTTQEKALKTEELKSQRSTHDDKEYIESELNRLMDEQESRGNASATEELTSARQAHLERDREAFGLKAMPEKEAKPFEDMIAGAREKNIPERARDIVADANTNGTIWDDDTTVGVGLRYRTAVDSLLDTQKAMKTAGPQELPGLMRQEAEQKQEVDFYSDGLHRSGTPQGRALVSRKIGFGSADDPATALIRARQKKTTNTGGVKARESREKTQGQLEEKSKTLEAKIETFGANRKANPKAPVSPEEQNIRNELDKVHKDLKAVQKAKTDTDLSPEERDNILSKAAAVRSAQDKRNALEPGTLEYDDADFALHKARIEFEDSQNVGEKTSLLSAASAMSGLWRTWHTTLDLGATGIQGGKTLVSNPIMSAKNIGESLKSFHSEMNTFKTDREIAGRANSDLYDKGYVTLLKENDPFSQREGLLGAAVAQKIPIVKDFERAFRTYVNKTRADLFDYRVALEGGRENLTDANLRGIGQAVDTMTGRGGNGYADNWAADAGLIAYAPRNVLAEAEFMLGRGLWKSDPSTKKMIANMYSRTFANMAWLYVGGSFANTIAELAGEPDVVKFDTDTASPNFGKVQVGNTWVDPTFKIARDVQLMTNTAQLIHSTFTGTDKKSIFAKNSRSGLTPPDSSKDETIKKRTLNYFRGKESLPLAAINDMVAGKHITGEPVTWQSMIKQYGIPITASDVKQSMESEYGLPEKVVQTVLNTFGIPAHGNYPKKPQPLKIK